VRSIHIELNLAELVYLGVEITRKIECSQLEWILTISLTIYHDLQFKFQLAYQFVRDVLFCTAVIEKLRVQSLEFETSLLFELNQIMDQASLVFIETVSFRCLGKSLPEIDCVLAFH
jgi:hypothetical protein